MPSECSASFAVTFILGVNAKISLRNATVRKRPGLDQIYYWTVVFTYVTGDPPATAFRLNSADGLTGSFFPPSPISGDDPNEVRVGQCEGTVALDAPPNMDITYNGTITIIQA